MLKKKSKWKSEKYLETNNYKNSKILKLVG